MFDDTKLSVRVNMTGKEYIEYKKLKSPLFSKPMSKSTKEALPFFVFSGLMLFLLLFLTLRTSHEQLEPSSFQKATQNVLSLSWNDIGKLIVANYGFVIILLVGLAWVLHGFGFFIIKS